MPHYLIEVAYNSGGVAALVKEPQDRIEKVRPAIEALGGHIESAYYAFGEHDIVLTVEMPSNTAAAASAPVERSRRTGRRCCSRPRKRCRR